MNTDRRSLLLGAALAGCATTSEPGSTALPDYLRDTDPDLVLDLWPNGAPGGESVTVTEEMVDRPNPWNLRDRAVTGIRRPTLSVFRPAQPDGSALLIIPGGGYIRVALDKEGFESGRWFASRGVTVFALLYRLPADGWAAGANTPLQDGQRAMRLIRARAAEFGIDPNRVAAQGFSAGGHLAAGLATRWDETIAPAIDDADRLSARPDLVGLIYPVITMDPAHAHTGSRDQLIGDAPTPEREAAYSPDRNIRTETPPTFLLHAADDPAVPVANSLLMYQAVRAAGIGAEMHIFEEGGHGFGLRGVQDKPALAWPALFHRYGVSKGIFRASPS